MLRKRIGVIMYQTSRSKGQELVAQRMVREFNKMGHDAYLITSIYHDGAKVISSKGLSRSGGYAVIDDSELGIPVIRVDSYVAKFPPRRVLFKNFMMTLSNIVDQFQLDVLITHSTLWNGPEEVAKFVEWRKSMRSIGGYSDPLVFCHMAHFQEPSNRYSLLEQTFRMAWNKVSFPQIFSTANLLLVVTDLEKKAKVKMGADPNKCFLFPGGVDDEILCHANIEVNSMLKRLNVQTDVKIISYLGSLEERKNPMAILEVAKLFQNRKNIHFVIAGRGDSVYATKVVETAKGLSNVTYLGEITEKEKVQLIKVSYLNVLLSKLEALGLTQLEFMFFGVPIITSGVNGQAWLIRDNVEGIHVNGSEDVEGASVAINRLVNNQDLWRQLSTNAKKRAMDLTISNLTSELDEVLTRELMKARGLTKLPPEIRATLEEPEDVMKSWSFGGWGVVATGKRFFIKSGFISRKVTEIPYSNISSIEYTRRYAWKTLIVGLAISVFLFIVPFLEPIFSRAFLGWLAPISESPALATFFDELSIFPFVASVIVFIRQARVGFTLRGPGIKAVYLPGKFRNAISFIRKMQNGKNEQKK
ncbi:glycosyltransferase [Candidatus Bathyarchaeota archaeon]|nr:glycosyltransferase [Candidatus Bathyarchaeota archaeon]